MARNDPFAACNFLIETNGILGAGFSECTGLTSETDAIEYRDGNEEPTVRKLPGLKKFGNVTLKRGVVTGQEFLDWRKTVTDGATERLDISIIILDEQRAEQVRYNLTAAWPCKWAGPDLKAAASEVAVESLELCHEGVYPG